MPEIWIRSYARALKAGDRLEMARLEALAADYDVHNPDSELVDTLDYILNPPAAA